MNNKKEHCVHVGLRVCVCVCLSNMFMIQCLTILLHRVNTNNGDKIKTNKNKAEVFRTFNTEGNSQCPVRLRWTSRSVDRLIIELDQSNPPLSLADQSDCCCLPAAPAQVFRVRPAERKKKKKKGRCRSDADSVGLHLQI